MFTIFEMFFSFVLYYIPYYSIVRIVFFVYLMAPQTNGAHVFYASVLAPYLKTHEKEINEFIKKVQDQATDVAKQAQAKANEVVTTEYMSKLSTKEFEAQDKMNEKADEVLKKE